MANSLIMSYVLKQFNNDQSPVNGRWFAYVNLPTPASSAWQTTCRASASASSPTRPTWTT